MFENLDVKDFKDAQAKYLKALEKQKESHEREIRLLHQKHVGDLSRHELRIEQLRNDNEGLRELQKFHNGCPGKEGYDKSRQESRDAIGKWEKVTEEAVAKIKRQEAKMVSLPCRQYTSSLTPDLVKTEPDPRSIQVQMPRLQG